MSIFSSIIDCVKGVIKGVRTIGFETLVIDVIGYIPSILRSVKELIAMRKDGFDSDELKVLIDSALEEFDQLTGLDDEGNEQLDMLKGIPNDKAEEFLDHVKEMIRIVTYHQIKVDGYYEE